MLLKYLAIFFISMVPVLELRMGMTMASGWELNFFIALIVCVIGNMVPVPFIYFFARRILEWGKDKKFIGKIFTFFLQKGEKAGQKLVKTAGRGGLFVSLMLFVGIPIPGTGAWTGTLGASFLNMGFKSAVLSVCLGVLIAGIIMGLSASSIFAAIRL